MKTKKPLLKSKVVRVRQPKLSLSALSTDYEKDFLKWSEKQALLLQKREFSKLDIEHLVEEIESLGKNDKRSLKSHLVVLLQHMLKLKYQPHMTDYLNSWNSSVINARSEIEFLLEDSPSLKILLQKIFKDSYKKARENALEETRLPPSELPKECPWKFENVFPNLRKKK